MLSYWSGCWYGATVLVASLVGVAPARVARGGVVAADPPAGFVIERHGVRVDRTRRRAEFEIHFSQHPDFFHVDSVGRQANSFQVFVNPNWSGDHRDLELQFEDIRDIIRGEEIHAGGELRVRDATP